jgi:hypothetical protein
VRSSGRRGYAALLIDPADVVGIATTGRRGVVFLFSEVEVKKMRLKNRTKRKKHDE